MAYKRPFIVVWYWQCQLPKNVHYVLHSIRPQWMEVMTLIGLNSLSCWLFSQYRVGPCPVTPTTTTSQQWLCSSKRIGTRRSKYMLWSPAPAARAGAPKAGAWKCRSFVYRALADWLCSIALDEHPWLQHSIPWYVSMASMLHPHLRGRYVA